MDPEEIGRFIKSEFPQGVSSDGRSYADIPDQEIGQLYIGKHGASVRGIQEDQLDIKDVPQEQRPAVSIGLQAVGFEPKTVAEEKEDTESGAIRGVVANLFNQFNRVPQGVRGPVIGNLAATVPGISPEARRYEKTRAGIAGSLKKIVGESGRLTDKDIDRIKNLLPSVSETPEEQRLAIQDLNSFLEAKGIEPVEVPGQAGPQRQTAQQLADRGFLQNLLSLEGTKRFATEAPPIAAQGLAQLPAQISDVLKGDIGSAVERGREFEDEAEKVRNLEKAAKAEIGSKIETAFAVSAIKNFFSKKAQSLLKGTPPKAAKEVLEEASKKVDAGKAIRNEGIEQAQKSGKKVNGSEIFRAIKAWADDAGALARKSQKKQIDEFLTEANKRFNGKLLNPKTAKRRWDIASKGFTSSGKAGKPIEAGFHRAVRDGVRKELDDITGGAFEKGTEMISRHLDENKMLQSLERSINRKAAKEAIEGAPAPLMEFLKGTGKRAAQIGGGALALGAIAKLLGVRFPGAAGE